MKKKLLTMQNIRSDLRHQLRRMVVLTIVCAVFFTLFSVCLFLAEPDEPEVFLRR